MGWDFYEELLPAAESLGEIPIIDELVKNLLDGLSKVKSKKSKQSFVPLETREERIKAFEDIIREEKEADNG